MTRRGLGAALTGGLSALATACSPLAAFNSLAPRDRAIRVGRDLAFGDDPRQKLDIYAPAHGAQGAPVLIFFYGGAWNSGRRQDYAFAGQALASRGFVTVVPDYRLAPQWRYPAFMQDAASATRWVRDHVADYGGDPGRISLAGHSAGGYIAVMLALDAEFLHAVAVDPATIRAVAGLSGPYDFLPLDVDSTKVAFGGYPDLAATQPIGHVHPGAPPMFLAWGAADTLVGPRNIAHLSAALRAAGDEVETRIYPGVSHADTVLALSPLFRRKAPVLADMSDFLLAHAGH